jgi:hypothetical protein
MPMRSMVDDNPLITVQKAKATIAIKTGVTGPFSCNAASCLVVSAPVCPAPQRLRNVAEDHRRSPRTVARTGDVPLQSLNSRWEQSA